MVVDAPPKTLQVSVSFGVLETQVSGTLIPVGSAERVESVYPVGPVEHVGPESP